MAQKFRNHFNIRPCADEFAGKGMAQIMGTFDALQACRCADLFIMLVECRQVKAFVFKCDQISITAAWALFQAVTEQLQCSLIQRYNAHFSVLCLRLVDEFTLGPIALRLTLDERGVDIDSLSGQVNICRAQGTEFAYRKPVYIATSRAQAVVQVDR